MKMQLYTTRFRFVIAALIAISLLNSCKNRSKDISPQKTKPEKGFTDFNGAVEFEFNMVRNPVTGTIPEGTYEAEMAQANSIYKNQLANGILSLSTYIFQGPENLGGRTRAVVYDKRFNGTSNQVIIAGGVSGGVYKSIDNGATWVRKSNLGDHFSCTTIAQDPRAGFEDTWYYGTGESLGNSTGATGAFYTGNGVYKSTDNGETWTRLASSNTTALETFSTGQDCIQKIIVDPTDGNIYVACLAKIMRSTNGGTTWADVLPGVLANTTQATDVVVSTTGRLYASFSGTNDSGVDGVWASAPGPTSGDAGSWTRIAGAGAGGSPAGWNFEAPSASPPTAGGYGRVVLAIPPSAETLLYALYWNNVNYTCGAPAPEAELFRWDDAGGTWTDLSGTLPNEPGCLEGNDPFAVQTGYDLVIAVKPDAAGTLFIGGTNAYRSTDAGLSWTRIGGYASVIDYALYAGSHPDIHSFAFSPISSTTMLCGNDGGIQRTTANLAATVAWTPINTGFRTYQYYHTTLDPRLGNAKVLGGAQDNGSTRNIGGTGSSFELVWGGDGVSVGLSDDIAGTTYEYVGSQLGSIRRRTSGTILGSSTNITPTGELGTGIFVTYFKLDADNTQTLYYGNDNALYRTTSASTVTTGVAGPPGWTSMTGVATSIAATHDITAMATTRGTYSAATASLFIGASDVAGPITSAKLFRLDNPAAVAAGTAPVDITGASFPAASFISSIAVNPRNDDTIMVTFSNYGVTGNVWWTGNANSATPTWTNVEGTLTAPSFRSSAIAVTATGVEYYVGTSVGLYNAVGLPGTISWAQDGAPEIGNAVVSSLALRPSDNKLLVGTHGYGMWSAFLTTPLPVTLAEFDGAMLGKNVLLQWKTSAEYNSKQFELEKSYNGTAYRKIATIPAAGNSSTIKNYSYVDREPLTEKNYYRLRVVDIDGANRLSNTVLIKPQGVQQDMLVMGNPFKNTILIRFVKEPESAGEIRLVDASGRLIATERFVKGQQQVPFDLPPGRVSRGIYSLQTIINGQRFVKQVMKE